MVKNSNTGSLTSWSLWGGKRSQNQYTVTHGNKSNRLCIQGGRESSLSCLAQILILSRNKTGIAPLTLAVAAFCALAVVVIMDTTLSCSRCSNLSDKHGLLFPLRKHWVPGRQIVRHTAHGACACRPGQREHLAPGYTAQSLEICVSPLNRTH